MERELYCVLDTNGNVLAYHMELRHALLFIQALMLEYFQSKIISASWPTTESCGRS